MHKAYLLLRKVPRGKVVTYGELAKACNTSPRAIGALMRSNTHPELYPCYKVIMSSGKVGGYCGQSNGKRIKKKLMLLKMDRIKIVNSKIDLKKFGHKFSK